MDYNLANQIGAIELETNLDALLDAIANVTTGLGFEYFCFGHKSHMPISTPKLNLLNNYPRLWQSAYQDNDYSKQDPTVFHALRSTAPLIWDDSTFVNSPNLKEDAASFGIEYGWSQATRSEHGVSMLTLVRSAEPLSKQELHIKSGQLLWLTQIINSKLEPSLLPNINFEEVVLTKREAEVMRWTTDGKTASEIAMILSISERTVNFHLNNVMKKLDTHNKISATVKAITLNLL